jgi:hypothetical protein
MKNLTVQRNMGLVWFHTAVETITLMSVERETELPSFPQLSSESMSSFLRPLKLLQSAK